MAQGTRIEWADHTANLWWGCTNVHEGCDNCYAETLSHRWGNDVWGNDKPRREIKSVWKDLERFQKLAATAGEIHRVFVGSMMDIFEKPMPLVDINGEKVYVNHDNTIECDTGLLREEFFMEIDAGKYPNLLFLLLTKRPSNINKYIPEEWKENPPANVMYGISVVNQATADTLIPQFLKVKGYKFLSCEPLLGAIDLYTWVSLYKLKGDIKCEFPIHWIITGGESGVRARPMHPDWPRILREQCKTFGVDFFFKQWGSWVPVGTAGKEWDEGTGEIVKGSFVFSDDAGNKVIMNKVGKKAAGALLDGVEHKEFPNIINQLAL